MIEALETTQEITKLIKYSPRREGIFQKLKESVSTDKTPGVRVLCSTRWTVKANSLASVVANYETLQRTWEKAVTVVKDTETKARIRGVSAQMKTFEFLFKNMLRELILKHTDNLNGTLQHKCMSAAEGQKIAQMTTDTLKLLRNDESFDLFWEKVNNTASILNINKSQLPRQQKQPRRYDDGLSTGEFL